MKKRASLLYTTARGFTLIELLVVISVLAILATILLISLKTFIDKGKDAAIKHNMANLLAQGNIYLLEGSLGNGYYDGFCVNNSAMVFIDEINKLASPNSAICNCNTDSSCAAPATAWCVGTQLKKVGLGTKTTYFYFCVDSTGKKKESSSYISGASVCSSGLCQ